MVGIVVGGKSIPVSPELAQVLHTYADEPARVFRFKNATRSSPVWEVIVHETVTRSWPDTVAVLKQRNLGVHFIIGSNGYVYQHGDLATDSLWHASLHNTCSVGIELVNPFDPKLLTPGDDWKDVLSDAPWSVGANHSYVLPTLEQLNSLVELLKFLTNSELSLMGMQIPRKWRGLLNIGHECMSLTRVASCAAPPEPGILAHTYFSHGDGAWPVLCAWLIMEAGLDLAYAYASAKQLATRTLHADVSRYRISCLGG